MKFLILFMFLISSAFAMNEGDVSVSKEELIKAIEAMRDSGQFSEADIQKALNEVNAMSDKDLQKTVEKGKAMKDNPNIRAAAKNIKLDDADKSRVKYDPKQVEENLKKLQEVMKKSEELEY